MSKIPDWMPEEVECAPYGFKDGFNACRKKVIETMPDYCRGWISMEDRLPEAGMPVLCWPPIKFDKTPTGYTVVMHEHREKKWFVFEGNGAVYNHNPTHWMPLPPEPEES